MLCPTLEADCPKSYTMEFLHGPDWNTKPNLQEYTTQMNFSFCEKFQLLSEEGVDQISKMCDFYANDAATPYAWSTSRTPRCLRGPPLVVSAIRSEQKRIQNHISRIAGYPLRMSHVDEDIAHVNLQVKPQTQAVDDWHMDSVPFVLIVILTDHSNDPSGETIVKKESHSGNEGEELVIRWNKPGQAMLMQGQHLLHCARPSKMGKRTTVVITFVPDTLDHVDSYSFHYVAKYMPACCVSRTLQYRAKNIATRLQDLLSLLIIHSQFDGVVGNEKQLLLRLKNLIAEFEWIPRTVQQAIAAYSSDTKVKQGDREFCLSERLEDAKVALKPYESLVAHVQSLKDLQADATKLGKMPVEAAKILVGEILEATNDKGAHANGAEPSAKRQRV